MKRTDIIKSISKLVLLESLKRKVNQWLIVFFNAVLTTALFVGFFNLKEKQDAISEHSHEVRELWDNSPDKNPHRMAHYGYVAFREKYPLSFFDFGMDNYLGNSIFLEAHKQNTVNFSEASFSNSLLRFGEISAGMIFQLLLPLLIFFWGFDLITRDRETGTLRIVMSQAVSWKELILGKTLGLFTLSLFVLLPSIIIVFALNTTLGLFIGNFSFLIRFFMLVFSYLVYYLIASLLAVIISSRVKSSKAALIQLIGFWLFFTLMLPKISQSIGQIAFPAPSKVEFDAAVEREIIKQGDSHNPNDPHYKELRDSLLTAYNVESITDLPFNYSGIIMQEGEKLSSNTYKHFQDSLTNIFKIQQNVVRWTAIFNPYMAIKNLSMALSGTDFAEYNNFQKQTEGYRYQLVQALNKMQIEHVKVGTSLEEKDASISNQNWKEIPYFTYDFLTAVQILKNEWLSILSLLIWIAGLFLVTYKSIKNLKAY
ncbi:MAG: DUF3526 domain-containing protein [Bacteroidales bacterium]|nr:DUF3526 domain-containing protein [Bacteroidales bacterium]